jgi:hypothetical protein
VAEEPSYGGSGKGSLQPFERKGRRVEEPAVA